MFSWSNLFYEKFLSHFRWTREPRVRWVLVSQLILSIWFFSYSLSDSMTWCLISWYSCSVVCKSSILHRNALYLASVLLLVDQLVASLTDTMSFIIFKTRKGHRLSMINIKVSAFLYWVNPLSNCFSIKVNC